MSILDYLGGLDEAVDEIANTWRPDDPQYRADIYQQIMMSLSYSYFVYFHADPEHPDWSPLWNPVYRLQPNPDDIYLYAPVRGDLRYRVAGNRGTVKMVTFSTNRGGLGIVDKPGGGERNSFDDRDLDIAPNGDFEVLFSNERPTGHTGNWARLAPDSNHLMVRCRSEDWGNERDPELTIECLDPAPPKRRLTPDEIYARIREMAQFPARASRLFLGMQNDIKQRAGINNFELMRNLSLDKQIYWQAVYDFEPGEALIIIETEMPTSQFFWNVQLNDPYFNIVEYVYRLSSLNAAFARMSSDGKLRAVVSIEDPGVPNWLDTAGFLQGTIYGRWYDADSHPVPTLKRVPLGQVRNHLPADTPIVTPEQRAEEVRQRVLGAQRRRRW